MQNRIEDLKRAMTLCTTEQDFKGAGRFVAFPEREIPLPLQNGSAGARIRAGPGEGARKESLWR